MLLKTKPFATKHFILRSFTAADYEAWYRFNTDRNPAQNLFDFGPMSGKETTKAHFHAKLKKQADWVKQDRVYIFGGFDRKTGELLGVIDIYVICRARYQLANLGYQVHNKYWGKGYGKELCLGAARIAFKEL